MSKKPQYPHDSGRGSAPQKIQDVSDGPIRISGGIQPVPRDVAEISMQLLTQNRDGGV
jgi:hypothetical protein